MSTSHSQQTTQPDPPRAASEAIAEFVHAVASRAHLKPEKRAERRYHCPVPVRVTPLDDALQVAGPTGRAVLRDISTRGIGILLMDRINTNYAEVELGCPPGVETEPLRVALKVLRCRAIQYGMCELGGTFLTDAIVLVERKSETQA